VSASFRRKKDMYARRTEQKSTKTTKSLPLELKGEWKKEEIKKEKKKGVE